MKITVHKLFVGIPELSNMLKRDNDEAVRWTAPALIDLNEAIACIANDSPKAATSVGIRIAEAPRT